LSPTEDAVDIAANVPVVFAANFSIIFAAVAAGATGAAVVGSTLEGWAHRPAGPPPQPSAVQEQLCESPIVDAATSAASTCAKAFMAAASGAGAAGTADADAPRAGELTGQVYGSAAPSMCCPTDAPAEGDGLVVVAAGIVAVLALKCSSNRGAMGRGNAMTL
jgi:hypothetical protein